MPRDFFHRVDSIDILLDPEGVEMSADAIAAAALLQARDCMAGDVKDGRLDLHYHIEVQDEASRVVHTLPFSDALEIVPAP